MKLISSIIILSDYYEYLRRWDIGKPEYIIQDSMFYSLVIFSASWCVPYQALIPIIREIDSDLKDKLYITYISTDNEKIINN